MKHRIDICSDTHWDFYIPRTDPEYAQTKKFNKLFDIILPNNHSNTLLLAGDLGHSNDMNELAFQLLKERGYKNILWCYGNHSLYLISKSQATKYEYDSFKRLEEMVQKSNAIEGVRYLNGSVVNIDGLNIGGCGMHYDFQYGVVELGLTIQQLTEVWKQRSNDSRLIYVNSPTGSLDNLSLFNEQYTLLKGIYNQCDVVVTHVGPDWSHISPQYKDDPTTAFYYFDGRNLLDSEHRPKLWVFGHTHLDYDYFYKGSSLRMVCNPLGYPLTDNWQQEPFSQRIKTIVIDKD